MFSYVCKLQIIEVDNQKNVRPKRPENLSMLIKKKSGDAKRCLFGVPDPKDTERMMQEQQEKDNLRFKERFGFTAEDLENLEKENDENVFNGKPQVKSARKVLKAKRKVFSSFNNQAVLTGT